MKKWFDLFKSFKNLSDGKEKTMIFELKLKRGTRTLPERSIWNKLNRELPAV